jgi:hypothetical protein
VCRLEGYSRDPSSVKHPVMRRFASLMFCVGLSVGCGADPSPAPGASDAHAVRPPTPEPEVPRYAIDVELPAGSAAGREALAKVHVHGRGDWHLNTKFPVALRLKAPEGVVLVAAEQARDDAERLDDSVLTFSVPFTPRTAGPKRFEGQLSFAMCTDDACDPLQVPLDFTVDVRDCEASIPC